MSTCGTLNKLQSHFDEILEYKRFCFAIVYLFVDVVVLSFECSYTYENSSTQSPKEMFSIIGFGLMRTCFQAVHHS